MEGAVDKLREALDWAGLDYDEGMYNHMDSTPCNETALMPARTAGIGRGGPHEPYTQVSGALSWILKLNQSVRTYRSVPTSRPAAPLSD